MPDEITKHTTYFSVVHVSPHNEFEQASGIHFSKKLTRDYRQSPEGIITVGNNKPESKSRTSVG